MHTVHPVPFENIIVSKCMSVLNRLNYIVILFILGKITDIVYSSRAI